jgi:hypothetical protein
MTKFLASFNWVVWLGILVAIETQLGNGTMSLANMVPDAWIPFVKAWAANLGSVGALILAYNSTDADRPAAPIDRAGLVKVLLVAIALSTLLAPGAFAADNVPASPPQVIAAAPIARGYPSTKCGVLLRRRHRRQRRRGRWRRGRRADRAGQSQRHRRLYLSVRDRCVLVRGSLVRVFEPQWIEQRPGAVGTNGGDRAGRRRIADQFAAGQSIRPCGAPALPSIPLLPAGVTTSPGNGYVFAGLVEQDIGAQIGLLHGHQWVVAPLFGIGLLTRASNNVMIDTWAGVQTNSQSFCPGGGSACAKLGNMARIGVSFKY